METRMLGYERAASVTDIASWANALVGKEIPGLPEYRVVRVIQFQFIHSQSSGYDAMVLAEVSEMPDDTARLALREEDVEVIEQLTSSVNEVPHSQQR